MNAAAVSGPAFRICLAISASNRVDIRGRQLLLAHPQEHLTVSSLDKQERGSARLDPI